MEPLPKLYVVCVYVGFCWGFWGEGEREKISIYNCVVFSYIQPSMYDSPSGLTAMERVAIYLRKLENGPKPKPIWDSVKELLLECQLHPSQWPFAIIHVVYSRTYQDFVTRNKVF